MLVSANRLQRELISVRILTEGLLSANYQWSNKNLRKLNNDQINFLHRFITVNETTIFQRQNCNLKSGGIVAGQTRRGYFS